MKGGEQEQKPVFLLVGRVNYSWYTDVPQHPQRGQASLAGEPPEAKVHEREVEACKPSSLTQFFRCPDPYNLMVLGGAAGLQGGPDGILSGDVVIYHQDP